MRVGLFTNNYLPTLGGVPRSVETLRLGLERSGHGAYVFAPRVPGFSDLSAQIFRGPSVPAPTYPDFFVPLPVWPRLSSTVRNLDLDLFHAHHPFLLGQAARRLAAKFRRPLIFTYHTKYDAYTHYVPFLQVVVRRLAINLSTAFSNQADLVIAPSHGIATRLSLLGVKSRIEVVPTGVDLKLFAPGDHILVRRQLRLPSDALILLYVGRLDREKSVEFLLRAFASVGSNLFDTYLILVGAGKEGRRLRALASSLSVSDRILFVGSVPMERVVDYYRAADLFLFASQTETQGLAIAEAFATGLPVVAVRASGVEDVVQDGETGFLVPADVAQFSSAVQTLLSDRAWRRQMGERARDVAAGEFSAEQSVARHVELYQQLLG